MIRDQATDIEIEHAFAKVKESIEKRLRKHGRGKWVSPHEAFGITAEEVHELMLAVHGNDRQAAREECLDIAICGLWGYLSLTEEKDIERKT